MAATCTWGVASNEINQIGANDIITSRSCDKLKIHLHHRSAYDYKTWQDSVLPWWAPALNVIWPFNHASTHKVTWLDHHVTN